jgi:thioredoxin reductase
MNEFDVVVIGGGAAGLSGALTLTRARRSVLVLDAGEPRNAPATGVHGFLTRDGLRPSELAATGAAEVAHYGGTVRHVRVTSARREATRFVVGTGDGEEFGARWLLVTTGLVDELPDLPGLRELWGRDVLHCPYCHGHEVRDQPIGVLGTGPTAVHQALLFRQWSADVTLFRHTAPDPIEAEREQLAARGVAVVENPRGVGSHVETDPTGLHAAPGVWAAGNVADLMTQVVGSASAGVTAGAAINADLVAEDTRLAVERWRSRRQDPFSAESEARVCEQLAGDRRHGL